MRQKEGSAGRFHFGSFQREKEKRMLRREREAKEGVKKDIRGRNIFAN